MDLVHLATRGNVDMAMAWWVQEGQCDPQHGPNPAVAQLGCV